MANTPFSLLRNSYPWALHGHSGRPASFPPTAETATRTYSSDSWAQVSANGQTITQGQSPAQVQPYLAANFNFLNALSDNDASQLVDWCQQQQAEANLPQSSIPEGIHGIQYFGFPVADYQQRQQEEAYVPQLPEVDFAVVGYQKRQQEEASLPQPHSLSDAETSLEILANRGESLAETVELVRFFAPLRGSEASGTQKSIPRSSTGTFGAPIGAATVRVSPKRGRGRRRGRPQGSTDKVKRIRRGTGPKAQKGEGDEASAGEIEPASLVRIGLVLFLLLVLVFVLSVHHEHLVPPRYVLRIRITFVVPVASQLPPEH